MNKTNMPVINSASDSGRSLAQGFIIELVWRTQRMRFVNLLRKSSWTNILPSFLPGLLLFSLLCSFSAAAARADDLTDSLNPTTDRVSSLGLDFSLPDSPLLPDHSASNSDTRSTVRLSPGLDALFAGGVNSLVARAVGSAEGTRTGTGDRTKAYYGHVDPGNGVWNLGSFSYQHEAKSPEQADDKQLQRLRHQAEIMQAKAVQQGLVLNLAEKLNGIDLANQAPLAALDREGYIDWLGKAYQVGKQGTEAILWARTYSFLDPVTQKWNAPGLGNTFEQIWADQQRRMMAIEQAIEATGGS